MLYTFSREASAYGACGAFGGYGYPWGYGYNCGNNGGWG